MSFRPRIFHSLSEVPSDFGPCVTTIGNFDGVHVGHQALMKRVAAIARDAGLQAAVLTFDPHPAKIVAPLRAPKVIMTLEQRAEVMGQLGIQEVLILPFTHEVSQWTPEQFIQTVLADAMQVRVVLVGDDFRFGNKQAGDIRLLAELGEACGFRVEPIEPVNVRGERASSSLVRQMAAAGRVNRVCRLLGRPFSLEGDVVKGHGIGSKQTVPTLNLRPATEVWPAIGVYVTRTRDLGSGRSWKSISNVGMRPTFGGEELTVETFLLEPIGDETPKGIHVEFLWRVRDERKFPSATELKAQIMRDAGVAQEYFRRTMGKGRITG